MDVATFPLTRQNLTHSTILNLLVYDAGQSYVALFPLALISLMTLHMGFVHMLGVASASRKSFISKTLYFVQFAEVFGCIVFK